MDRHSHMGKTTSTLRNRNPGSLQPTRMSIEVSHGDGKEKRIMVDSQGERLDTSHDTINIRVEDENGSAKKAVFRDYSENPFDKRAKSTFTRTSFNHN